MHNSQPITSNPDDLPGILAEFGGGLFKAAMPAAEMLAMKNVFDEIMKSIRGRQTADEIRDMVNKNGGLQLCAFADIGPIIEFSRVLATSLLTRHRRWIAEYLQGQPIVPLGFITYRLHEPDETGINPQTLVAFHQDRYFLGDIPMVNFWLPFDDCNVEAPGLELVVAGEKDDLRKRLPLVTFDTGNPASSHTEEQLYSIYPEEKFFHPPVQVGDAMVFNNFMPHRTYVTPGMHRSRSNLEIRVFRAGQLPADFEHLIPLEL